MLPCAWTRTRITAMRSRFSCSQFQPQILLNATQLAMVCATRRSPLLPDYFAHKTPDASFLPSYRLYSTDSGSAPSTAAATSPSSNNPTAVPDEKDPATSEKLRKVLRKVPFPVVVISTASPHDSSLRRGITVSSFTSISLQPIPLIAFCVKLPSRASTVLHESDRFVVQFLASDQIAHSVAFSSSVPPPPSVVASLLGSETGAGAESGSTPSTSSVSSSKQSSVAIAGPRTPQDKDIQDLVSEASRQTLIENKTLADSSTTTTTAAYPSRDSIASTTTVDPDPDPFEVLGYETDPESDLPVLLNTLGAIRCRTHQVMVVGDHEMWIGHVEKVLHGEIPDQQEPLLYHDRSYRRVGRRIF